MNAAQWAIIEEIGRDLKRYSEMLVEMDLDDPFKDLLRGWSHTLAVLCWEVYESCVVLVRVGRMRAAYALGRSLLDYYLRLNYYYEDSLPCRLGWKHNVGELLPGGCPGLYRTIMWRDWNNMLDKMTWYMQQLSGHDLSGLDDAGKKIFANLMRKQYEAHQTQVRKMFKNVKGKPAYVSELRAEYGMRSGYLHGDQSAAYELFVEAEKRPGHAASYESRFSEQRVLGSNAQLTLLFMAAIGDATGRPYAADVLDDKLIAAFGTS